MNMRKLGKSGLEVAPLVLGGNVFGWTVDERTSFKLLDAFVGEGFNFIDTANVYSNWAPGNRGGESENVIGNWLRQRPGMRARVLITTKVGMAMEPGRGGLSKARIVEEVNGSLGRLNTDYIDVYQSHVDDLETPLSETLEVYATLIREGKVRSIGASNHTAARLSEALKESASRGYPRYESLEPRYNLCDREHFEGLLAEVCRTEELGVIPYFALANGFLTGKYRSEAQFLKSARGQAVKQLLNTKEMFNERGRRILAGLDRVSSEVGATAAQVSLAWLLAQGVTAPIASATSREQLNELMRGVTLELPASAISLLNEVSAPVRRRDRERLQIIRGE